ncbi:MAG: hypothetical protein PVI07_13605 [Anaerolineae bacterium]|jgi:hypothetical protein
MRRITAVLTVLALVPLLATAASADNGGMNLPFYDGSPYELSYGDPPVTPQGDAGVEAAPVGTGFTYQGQLTDGGDPADGSYDFEFKLYDDATAGSQVGSTDPKGDETVTDGLFTVELDFGSDVFTGDARWLEIGVRAGDSSGAYTTLTPRQALTATPYAHYALNAPWSGLSGVPAGFADGEDNDTTYTAGTGLNLVGTTFSADTTYLQRRVSGTCESGNAIRVIDEDGTVTCEPVGGGGAHDHLGDTWTGNTPLTIIGNFADAPLVLNNGGPAAASSQSPQQDGDGLRIQSAEDDGVQIDAAGDEGVFVNSAGEDGVLVESAGRDGLSVKSAGNDGLWVRTAGEDGVHVQTAGGGHGVFIENVTGANFDGIHIGSANDDGIEVESAGEDGFQVVSATDDGFQVDSAGGDGLIVDSVGRYGVYVRAAVDHGVYVKATTGGGSDGIRVDGAANDGVHVGSAGNDGLYVGTAVYDGVDMRQVGDDGLYVGAAGGDGVHVEVAYGDGVHVGSSYSDGVYVGWADDDGVYVSTADDDGVRVYSAGGYAGNFNGPVYVAGFLTKAGGGFKIDHPLDPENKYLHHSFVESPDMMNVYNGNVTLDASGEAWVELPAWFEALNQDFRYQLTPIGAPGPNLYIAEEVKDSAFAIAGGEPGMRVSWQVTGIRHDPWAEANRIPVEEDKPSEEQGTYLHPEAYGMPESRGLAYKEAQSEGYELPPQGR